MKKYIDAEKLIAEIKRRMELHRKASADGYIIDPNRLDEDEDILSFITSIQQNQPSLPSNLDEAAIIYINTPQIKSDKVFNEFTRNHEYMAFKAGAEWMAGQGETIEGDVEGNWKNQEDAPYETYVVSDCLPKDTEFKFGDNVVVQIRKK